MFPLKAGDLLAGALEEEVNDMSPFRFEVAIHEPGIVEGKSPLETVEQFRNLVSGLLQTSNRTSLERTLGTIF
jgi:hypothetical protein